MIRSLAAGICGLFIGAMAAIAVVYGFAFSLPSAKEAMPFAFIAAAFVGGSVAILTSRRLNRLLSVSENEKEKEKDLKA